MRLVVIANREGRRTELLEAAARRRPGLTMRLVPWANLLAGRADLRTIVKAGDIVRIDSPGKDFEAECGLLRAGGDGTAWTKRIDSLPNERGRIWWPAVWYRGLCRTLNVLADQLADCPPHRLTAQPDDIRVMFDKTLTHGRLLQTGVSVPPAVGRINGYDDLLHAMRQRGWTAVFVKLTHGSSASGSIAMRLSSRGQIQAFTTVEFDGIDADGRPKMYNTRRVRELTSAIDIGRVIDAISEHTAHAERWIPKAGIDGRTFDVRVLVINGRACHTVVRLSRGPMTNLHLLNARADAARVAARCGPASWRAMMRSCEAALAAFPQTQSAGVDLLIETNFRRHAILELNAFGDLLQGATWNGLDPYDAELAATFGDATFARPAAEVA